MQKEEDTRDVSEVAIDAEVLVQTVILSIIHLITWLNKSNLDCWLLITVQEIVVAEKNKFNIFLRDIFTGIKKNYEHAPF